MAAESLQDSDTQLAKLFEQAKEDFERETNKKLNVLRRFDTIDDFIEQIKKEKAAFGSFREHEHPNLFRHIRNALKPIQILAKLFAGPSGNVSNFMLQASAASHRSLSLEKESTGGALKLYFSFFKLMHSQRLYLQRFPYNFSSVRYNGRLVQRSIERFTKGYAIPNLEVGSGGAIRTLFKKPRQPYPCLITFLLVHETLQGGGTCPLAMRSYSKYPSF
jgi:hypothetical protein